MNGDFRIAFRREGEVVNAYLARPDTMADAVLVASMLVGLLYHPDTWAEYRALVQRAHERGGLKFGPTVPAPEHERAGHG